MISDQIARHEVQLAPYYSHFEITEFSQYQIMIDLGVSLMKSGSKKALHSSCNRNKTDGQKCCDLEQK